MKKINNPEIFVNHKKKLEKAIYKNTQKNPLLQQFCVCYLNSLTPKSIQEYTHQSLLSFLEKRFTTFLNVIESSSKEFLNLFQKDDTVCIELVCHDAQYLVFTLENVFKSFNLQVSKMYHPLFSVYKNKLNKAILIEKPKEKTPLLSSCYFECILPSQPISFKDLRQELLRHLYAVQFVTHDFSSMLKNLMAVQKDVALNPTPKKDFHTEWIELLDWLGSGHFSFFGYTEFIISKSNKDITVTQKKGSGLGILNSTYLKLTKSRLLDTVKTQAKLFSEYRSPFLFDSIKFHSPVKRSEDLMRLSLKIPLSKNKWIEYNFLGLLKRSSLLTKNIETPIIKLKINKIFEEKHYWPGSHNYNQTIRFLNNVPKYELFRTPTENLLEIIENLLSITNPNEIAFFTRRKIDKSRLFLMAVIPNHLFSSTNLSRIISYLKDVIPHSEIDYFTIPSEQFYRIHFYFFQPNAPRWYPNIQEIETHVQSLIRPWDQLLHDHLIDSFKEKEGLDLYHKYINAFPQHHKVRRSPAHTVSDIIYFEKTTKNQVPQFNIIPFQHKDSMLTGKAFLLLIYHIEKIDLFHFIPIFQNLKLYFFDELTTRVGSLDHMIGYIHAFRIKSLDSERFPIDIDEFKPRLVDCLHAVFSSKLPNDPINGLISTSSLTWKNIFIIQAYRNYLLQLKPNYSKQIIDDCILKHGSIISILIQYFYTKFSFHRSSSPAKKQVSECASLKENFINSLNIVSDINEDFILKWLFNLMESTLRTNYFQHELESSQLIAFKFDGAILQAPDPKPFKEIFVFSPEMEGIHIRFGPVSRGGLRWSNRLSDYRSEVLGLATTQRVKNVVIVPNGSKGGFVIKKKVDKALLSDESKTQYQTYINGLLSLTDNRNTSNAIIKPKQVVCYDDDDPYMVVAADKGTATFSDIANNISLSHNFWLGDAFASGGSRGYNHKDLGITAKGAWECVKLHFLESGKDISTETFTAIGIGDMSGDVFGNGLLLSKTIKLIAAFNHLHIFIDPDPDPDISYKERQRLFKLSKSSWDSYSTKLISKGGGVFSRASKSITLSKEIKDLLNIDKDALNGEELIHALLKIKAELLWLGGIGTYIKEDNESHSAASDIANNSVRINHSDFQCDIIGEGANLGITQSARLKLSQNNHRLNTDFIDNSAGVNISDYEVNLKIFLDQLLQKKTIKSLKERDQLLTKSVPEVIQKVLDNNIAQHQLISIESIRSKQSFSRYQTLINTFIRKGVINPKTTIIPSTATFEKLERTHSPFPRPLLALLQSIIKLDVSAALSKDPMMDHDIFHSLYLDYFPSLFQQKFSTSLFTHPLKRDITVTALTNFVVNNTGSLFFTSLVEITERSISDIAHVYFIIDYLLGCTRKRKDILSQDCSFDEKYQHIIDLEYSIKNAVIDALMIPKQLFTLKNIDQIQKAFTKFKEFQKKLSDKTSPNDDFHFISFYSIYQQFPHYNPADLLPSISIINRFFQFDLILHFLTHSPLENQWEVEEFKLLQKMLSIKKIKIFSKILSQINKKNPLTMDSIPPMFHKDIVSFKRHLDSILDDESISLSNLTVLINKLNLI